MFWIFFPLFLRKTFWHCCAFTSKSALCMLFSVYLFGPGTHCRCATCTSLPTDCQWGGGPYAATLLLYSQVNKIYSKRVVCPNFRHPALTLSITKYIFLQHAYSIYKVHKQRMTKLGQDAKVKAHYPAWANSARKDLFLYYSISYLYFYFMKWIVFKSWICRVLFHINYIVVVVHFAITTVK